MATIRNSMFLIGLVMLCIVADGCHTNPPTVQYYEELYYQTYRLNLSLAPEGYSTGNMDPAEFKRLQSEAQDFLNQYSQYSYLPTYKLLSMSNELMNGRPVPDKDIPRWAYLKVPGSSPLQMMLFALMVNKKYSEEYRRYGLEVDMQSVARRVTESLPESKWAK